MNKKLKADVVVDLQFGDCGKGKVTNSLLKSSEYTHCVRFNGGHNAGHTIYNNGKKIVTHVIPSGILQGVRSIIGPGCVVNTNMLHSEIQDLESAGIKVRDNLFIDKRVNLITDEHLQEDETDTTIGTTKRGNGPAYRDKYARKGIRAESLIDLDKFNITDIYSELFEDNLPVVALFEGAQGFGLDIDWGDYPYVTSSTCTVGGVVSSGIPPKCIRNIYGVAKAYQTYVGAKCFQPTGDIFNKIREIGCEYGATTGRARQVNYLDLDSLTIAANINGVTDLIMNKVDILQQLDEWKLYNRGNLINCGKQETFEETVKDILFSNCPSIEQVIFSFSPNEI